MITITNIFFYTFVIVFCIVIGGFLIYSVGRLLGLGFVESLKNFFRHNKEEN